MSACSGGPTKFWSSGSLTVVGDVVDTIGTYPLYCARISHYIPNSVRQCQDSMETISWAGVPKI